MLVDVKKKRNEQTEQAELLRGSTHDPQTQTHTVIAELGEGRDRPLPTCPENPTNVPGFPPSDDPCCHVSRILEQSHGTSASESNCGATANCIIVEQGHGMSASERNCGATANYIMVEQSHGTSVSERYCGATANYIMVEQSHGTSVSERIQEQSHGMRSKSEELGRVIASGALCRICSAWQYVLCPNPTR
jgi:hypothetical protein